MKKFLWSLVRKFFNSEITTLMNNHANNIKVDYHYQMQKEEETKRTLMNYPIGTKVISQSNEPNDLLVGTIVRHEVMHHGVMLVVEDESGKQFALLDKTPAYWYQEREDALRKLSWDERWNVMSKYFYIIDAETKAHKESAEYQNRMA